MAVVCNPWPTIWAVQRLNETSGSSWGSLDFYDDYCGDEIGCVGTILISLIFAAIIAGMVWCICTI